MRRLVILMGHLKNCVPDQKEVTAEGETAADILADLAARHPPLKKAFWGVDERLLVIVVLDGKILEKKEMDRMRVENGKTIRIYPIIGGG